MNPAAARWRPRVGITLGCPCGIGAEVVARALASPALRRRARWVILGSASAWEAVAPRELRAPVVSAAAVDTTMDAPLVRVDTAGPRDDFQPGRPGPRADAAARRALETAVDLAARGVLQAVATGPARKQAFRALRGGPFPGHTEFFHARLGSAPRPVMLFVAPGMRVALLTIHLPLREVPTRITRSTVEETLRVLRDGLRDDLGIPDPRIELLGLNPHASEGGLLGREDGEVLAPAVRALQAEGLRVRGPLPADGVFAAWHSRADRPDAVLAAYHDQGLGPFKLWERRRGCQLTLGLRVPRTACDHGTAYDAAGRGVADPRSMAAALALAATLAHRRAARTT
ncbi:MAG: 4-hydroxythreonine-4-phosphate dehydrogenase PdxA [Deltaproteobacteria bacterium]|nr:4-hydroxythreonine-4-phosphate dehydrogenase PdxA [Deltaproteobacteria bacterium]